LTALRISTPFAHALEYYEYRHKVIKDIEAELAKFEQELPTLRQVVIESALKSYGKPEQEPVANEKEGSPCPEFWDWLPKAYNFVGDGVFTKYNMEVAFLAGKQFSSTAPRELAKPEQVGKIPTLAEMKKLLNGEPIELAKPEQEPEQEPVSMLKSASVERAENAAKKLRQRNNAKPWDDLDRETVFAIDALVAFANFQFNRANTAPPRKPWVGLTDEEIEEAWGNTPMMLNARDGGSRKAFALAIEAKLEEKNT